MERQINVTMEIKMRNKVMSKSRPPLDYKGRSIGILAVVAVQFLVGFIHVVFGFWLLSTPLVMPFGGSTSASGPDVYSLYTIAFSFLTLIFATLLWFGKRWGWIGTVTVGLFVIVADSLTLLDLPSIPEIPKFAGFGEISYSVLVILFLMQTHIRSKYKIKI
jgi:hypothetical protein